MQLEPTLAYLLTEARNEASDYLGREVTDTEWEKAYAPATRKLAFIIAREGDAGGARRRPQYLGKLVQEQITASELSAYCEMMYTQKKTASEESGQSPQQVYRPRHQMSI